MNRLQGKEAEVYRLIVSRIKENVLFNGSSTDSDGNMSLADVAILTKLLRKAQIREAYLNGTVDIGTHFARTYIALGAIAIFLNLTILIILLLHRRHLFRHVFYLLIFNFAVIDFMKGICLITYALRMMKSPASTKSAQLTTFKFDQYMTLVFRFCNLATILNLLMITLNEFFFIKFPLRYHQFINRRLALILIVANWVLCIIFTVASTFAKGTQGRVYVSTNYTVDSTNRSMYSVYRPDPGVTSIPGVAGKMQSPLLDVQRPKDMDMEVHYIFAFTLTSICLLCLVVVLVCYTIFFQVIREIRSYDQRLYQDANRRVSELSSNSVDATVNNASYDDRKIKRQLLKRNKYALVIGSVILVCMLYLLSYSTIQIFQYIQLKRETKIGRAPSIEDRRESYIVRWSLQILVGLHSVFQPLCYFRMKEFRNFVKRFFCFACTKNQRERDYLASYAETNVASMAPTHKRSTVSQTFVVDKSTSLSDRIFFIFRKKAKSPGQLPQPPSQASLNNNTDHDRDRAGRKRSTLADQELIANELKNLMQNSPGTDL